MSLNQPTPVRLALGGPLTPMVKNLIIINVAVYLFLQLTAIAPSQIYGLLGLSPQLVLNQRAFWQPLTYMFLHDLNWLHLLFNMLVLWWLGCELERTWGSRMFLRFFLAAGVAAGLGVIAWSPQSSSITIGASGATMALLTMFGCLFPNRQMLLMLVLPIKAKYMVALLVIIDLLSGIGSGGDSVSHTAHISGFLFALLWYFYFYGRLQLFSIRRWWRRRRAHNLRLVRNKESGIKSAKANDDSAPTIH